MFGISGLSTGERPGALTSVMSFMVTRVVVVLALRSTREIASSLKIAYTPSPAAHRHYMRVEGDMELTDEPCGTQIMSWFAGENVLFKRWSKVMCLPLSVRRALLSV